MASPQTLRKRIFRELCAEHTEDALAVMVDVMSDSEQHPKTRMEAAKFLLEAAHGRAATQILVNASPDDPSTLTLGELDQLILQQLGDNAKPVAEAIPSLTSPIPS
jgi:hypothetical protein